MKDGYLQKDADEKKKKGLVHPFIQKGTYFLTIYECQEKKGGFCRARVSFLRTLIGEKFRGLTKGVGTGV